MKILKTLILIWLLSPSAASAQSQKQLTDSIELFLSKQSTATKDTHALYTSVRLYQAGTGKKACSIYLFGRMASHSRSYLLITDKQGKQWDFYGDKALETDLLQLQNFFTGRHVAKHKILRCYDLLIGNFFVPYRTIFAR